MKYATPHGPSAIRNLLLALLVVSLPGCGLFDEGNPPKNGNLEITGGGGESFTLVTSNDFDILVNDTGEDRQIYLYSADTVQVTAPFSQRYGLGSEIRFYFKAYADEALSEPIKLRFFVEGDERYHATTTLDGVTAEFAYSYR